METEPGNQDPEIKTILVKGLETALYPPLCRDGLARKPGIGGSSWACSRPAIAAPPFGFDFGLLAFTLDAPSSIYKVISLSLEPAP